MATELKMPALSPTMEEGTLAKWLVKEGDEVKSGDILAEIETDKATMEFEAVDEGTIEKILVPEGTDGVKVGQPIALLAGEGEAPSEPAAKAAPATPAQPASTEQPSVPAPESQQAEALPTPHLMETAARDLVADVAHTRDEPEVPEGTPLVTMTVREALRDAMAEEMRRDESVFVMGEDVGVFRGAFKVTDGLLDEFGERRVRDTPISENTIVGAGVGAAMGGLRPVVELMTVNFSLLALDQIVNHAAAIPYMFNGQAKVPMVIRMPGGGGHQLGPTHSHSLEALYLQVPGLLVACPSTPGDAKGLLKSAIRDDNPVVFIEHESLYGVKGEVDEEPDTLVPFGEAKVRREGTDVTIVGILKMANVAMEAAEILAGEHGVSAEVIDPRTLRPLDLDSILASVAKTNHVVIVEEGWPHGGVGANLSALITEQAFDQLDAPPQRVTGADVHMPYSKRLEQAAIPHEENVVSAALAALEGSI
ncbi:MAG TPA: pyruvate dehydrogenase complex E1 component subunit beta [Sphingomicrobium sp.]|nr:pyruvate dehydrogenase complex E1 component subunit beta [Sphingomicrobium sp.]